MFRAGTHCRQTGMSPFKNPWNGLLFLVHNKGKRINEKKNTEPFSIPFLQLFLHLPSLKLAVCRPSRTFDLQRRMMPKPSSFGQFQKSKFWPTLNSTGNIGTFENMRYWYWYWYCFWKYQVLVLALISFLNIISIGIGIDILFENCQYWYLYWYRL